MNALSVCGVDGGRERERRLNKTRREEVLFDGVALVDAVGDRSSGRRGHGRRRRGGGGAKVAEIVVVGR